MNKEEFRKKCIKAGVHHLNDYGYPSCNDENIITDKIYAAFFKSMLEGTQEELEKTSMEYQTISELLDDLNA